MTEKPATTHSDLEIKDFDRDSLHILPLAIIPLQTRAIARARLVKNARLESVIELFDDVETGSGQIDIEDLPKEFRWPAHPPHGDLVLLRKLGNLSSYDVFSLRVTLREKHIAVDSIDALRLSNGKVRELTSYMSNFTRPLIREIYGTDVSMQSFDDLLRLFRRPGEQDTLDKLRQMADRLGICLSDIPLFLENYGDIFLSVSYYRQCLDQLMPSIQMFLDMIHRMSEDYTLRSDVLLQKTCKTMESKITELMANASGCLENFERGTKDLWQNVSAERFRKVEQMVRSYHTSMGGALCCLSVKIDAWTRRFPTENSGTLNRQAQFLTSEMRLGFDRVEQLDMSPMLAMLN